jgi:hypothetical protein
VKAGRLLLATAAALGLTALAAWHFEWSFEKAALLAPVIVVAVGALAFLVVLWTKIVWESVRGRGASRSPADTRPDTGERRA